jgi:AraC family transcriptional regulator
MKEKDMQVRSFIGNADRSWADEGFHVHPSLEITILLEGSGAVEWLQGRSDLETGHIIIVPPDLPHRFEGMGRNRFGLIQLENCPPAVVELLNRFRINGEPRIFRLSRLDKERFEALFREWLRLFSTPLKETACAYRAWIEVLLLFLLEHSQTGQQPISIAKAADFIRENLDKGLQISDLAQLAGMAESGFRRLFEQVYHMSPKRYQQQCRMAEAKWLLNSSDKELNEIARQIGFERLHSFSQWFRKLEGMSPSQWRKNQQINFG